MISTIRCTLVLALVPSLGCSDPRPSAAACGGTGQACCTTGNACEQGRCGASSTCEVCGGEAQACCTTGEPCDAGRCGATSVCEVCGGEGEACCTTGDACDQGRCGPDDVCVLCGGEGQACCASGDPCDDGRRCYPDDVCVTCGGAGQACCQVGDACVEGRCNSSTQVCELCGGEGQACCTDGNPCDQGRCGSDGLCVTCGGDGLACCAEGDPCDAGLRCGWRDVCGPSDCGGGGEACCTTGGACWDQPEYGMTYFACYRHSCTACDPRYGCIWNTCGNGRCDGLPIGETCSTCPEDCGCVHGQKCDGYACSWYAIDGKVVDAETGVPLAGVQVIAGTGSSWPPMALTGADGSFVLGIYAIGSVSIVTVVVDGGVTHLTVFEGVRPPVTLPIASPASTPANSATLEVSVSGGEAVPAATTTTLAFLTSSASSGTAVDEAATQQAVSGPLPAPWTLGETWAGPPSLLGWLYVLQLTETGAFWGADYFLTLSSGQATPAEVTLAPMTAGTIAGTYASPADFSPAGAREVVWLGNGWHGPTDVQAFVAGEPGRFGVPAYFATNGPTSALCLELDDLLVAGGTSETCACPPASADALALAVDHASTLLGPADGASAFDPTATSVIYQAPSSTFSGYYVVTFDATSSPTPVVVDVFTTGRVVRLPDLSHLGFGLPPDTQVTWSVTSRGPKPLYQNVSKYTDTQDWRVTLPRWGCPGGTAQSTRSQARTFTTPAVSL